MRTIEDFFIDIEDFHDDLEIRDTKTIHTQEYEDTVRELYADWQAVKVSLKPHTSERVIEEIDTLFTDLLGESRRSSPRVSQSANYLESIENIYIEEIYPEISMREIEAGFVNSLVSELDQIEDDKYHTYIEEAIQCIQVGANRGAVVLGWQAAMYGLYCKLEEHSEPIHVAYEKKFHTKPDTSIDDFWDFQKLKDENVLILAEYIGIIDKSLKDMLVR
ncbi:hypothetical protein ACFQMF_13000 [Halorubrum rutilum]|uniref:Uncharacterized protein n=1 Tax=Halorubrum rutilum TaxID=1364933 RepID=A0ABD6AN98_9EURY|nr:hypothetical protein [Halorubrum rutilum]